MSTPSSDTTGSSSVPALDAISQLMRKAEMQQKQIELEIMFKHNMAVFEKVAPDLYERFINYSPEELRLSYSEDGYLELVNFKLNNKPVYPENPAIFSDKQYSMFCEKPSITAITFSESLGANPRYIHIPLINQMIRELQPDSEQLKPNTKDPIGLMLVTGTGMGYHIRDMSENLDIVNLMIYDPHPDSFYASLHTIDWHPILDKFCRRGKMLKLFIGDEENDAMTEMKRLGDKIGLHNMVYTYVYRHFNSDKENSFIEVYKKEFHLNATGTGYFDDEQISLAHTVHHLSHGVKVFKQDFTDRNLPTVFIIGNGPSLDGQIEYIKENQDNAIIISCGTALSSIAKVGIKPDFHVEMERIKITSDWIKKGSSVEFRKDIMLLCLNTCPPEMLRCFGEAAIAKKPNDLGEGIMDKLLTNKQFTSLGLCNPTVTNAGLAYAISMGFRNVYLLGIDMGKRPDGKHHSDLSIYTDLEKKTKTGGHSIFEAKDSDYLVRGNLGEEVHTNAILHSSKANLEILLRQARHAIPNFNCYNPNDGAYIDGAQPIYLSGLPAIEQQEDKHATVAKLKEHHFEEAKPTIDIKKDFHSQFLQPFFDIRKELTIPKNIDNIKDLHVCLNEIYVKVKKMNDVHQAAGMLLRGSLNGYFTMIIKGCSFSKNRAEFLESFNKGRKIYMSFIKQAYAFMEKDPYMLDDSYDKVLSVLDEED